MAATSTSWGLGAHKMTADISSPTPVTSPSADSPIRAKSFSMVEGPIKDSQVSSTPPTAVTSSLNGSNEGATAAAAAAAAVAAAATVAKHTANSNGIERVPASAGEVVPEGAVETEEADEVSEAAGTSSDSGGDDDEYEQGGSSGAQRRVGREGGGTQANGHHGPVQSARPAGSNGGNRLAVSPRQEVDEHAARASDAATAALAAALASATRIPPQRPARSSASSSPKLSDASQHAVKGEDREAAAAAASAVAAAAGAAASKGVREGGGRAARAPAVMMFRVPQGRDLLEKVEPPDVDRALAAARFVPQRPSSLWGVGPGGVGAGLGGCGGVDAMEIDADDAGALPLPLPLPTQPMPCMVGYFKVDDTSGVHRCVGTWAMTKADLEAAARIETRASPFEFRTAGEGGGGGALSFPHTGRYQGHFLVRQPPKPVTKVEENELHFAFTKNSIGGWNVEGSGRNIYGAFTITGRLGADRRLEVYRAYPKVTTSKHRRASTSSHSHAAATPARKAPATPVGRAPNRGKHAHSVPAARAAPVPAAAAALPSSGFPNGMSAMMVDDASLDTAPAGRRVSRTPSYLIKDIGNDGTAHLSHGLRRCVTLLRSLTVVRGKSEWFLEPVDHVALNLFDYPQIIKRPMDLGTVRRKLEGGHYQNTIEFASDVRLVFSNARLYNADPTSLVHTAARELYEMFETKLAALGPNLDDPPLKRKKANGGSTSGVGDLDHDYEPDRDRKRKSSGGGKGGGDTGSGGSGAGSASKKPRASSAPARPAPAPKPVAPRPPTPPPVAAEPSEDDSGSADMPNSTMLMMQRKIEEMEAQIRRMQGQGVGAAETPQKASSSGGGSKRKSKAGAGKAGGAAKGGAKTGKAGGSKKGGGSRGGANSNPEKVAADRAARTAKAAAAAAKVAEAAKAAAAAAVPLTFDEKKALSVAINKLDQTNLTRVVEIIQARMPLGSSDEEIELDIDSMDNLTLRDLQAFIMEVSAKGGSRNMGDGSVDSDSDAEPW